MLYDNFKDFIKALSTTGKIMAIDWGARRIGIALSDDRQEYAFPRDIIVGADISARGRMYAPLHKLTQEEKAVGIVIGLPLLADGNDSETTKQVREFANQVAGQVQAPVGFVDESLTSHAAAEINKNSLDSVAAAITLEDALAQIKRHRNV